ncbi:Uncharacterised protein [uncultured archaeon]|nr:Uncharacterised protein [uncultured archaeon]
MAGTYLFQVLRQSLALFFVDHPHERGPMLRPDLAQEGPDQPQVADVNVSLHIHASEHLVRQGDDLRLRIWLGPADQLRAQLPELPEAPLLGPLIAEAVAEVE